MKTSNDCLLPCLPVAPLMPRPPAVCYHSELFSSSRHHLGIYRAVVVACRYRLPKQLLEISNLQSRLYNALSQVVGRHPMLRVGIARQDSSHSVFCHVPELDLRRQVEFETLIAGEDLDEVEDGRVYDDSLGCAIGRRLNRCWQDIETRPPWALVVVGARITGERVRAPPGAVDIIFAFHHSLMDGVSGRIFHEALLDALNNSPSSISSSSHHILSFPDPPILPEGQTAVVDFTVSPSFVVHTLWAEFGPRFLKPGRSPIWHGRAIDFSLPYETIVRPVFYDADVLDSLLVSCRLHSATITGLFNALTAAILASHLVPADDETAPPLLAASTPISLRPFMAASADPALRDSLRCLITQQTHRFPPEDTRYFTAGGLVDGDDNDDAAVWRLAARVTKELTDRTATLPADTITGLMSYVSDWHTYWRSKDGQPREESFSVSNLGVLGSRREQQPANNGGKAGDNGDEETCAVADAVVHITHALFSNGAMVAGPAIGVNLVSAAGGCLGLTLSWQRDVVDEGLMQRLEADLRDMPRRLHETGSFFN